MSSTGLQSARSKKPIDDSKKFYKEIAALNYGLSKREKEVCARNANRAIYEDSGTNRKVTTFQSFQGMLDFVDDEITTSLRKTSWKKLSHQYKIKFAKEYILNLDINPQVKDNLLQNIETTINKLNNVDYDQHNTKVIKLNLTHEGVQV